MVIELDVTQYKPLGVASDDYTEAIELALQDMPAGKSLSTCPGAPTLEYSGCILRFPTIDTRYRITRTIVLPADRSVALLGTGPFGVTIFLDQDLYARPPDGLPVGYAFLLPGATSGGRVTSGTRRSVLFERLTLVGGGIAFKDDVPTWTAIRECVFRDAPDWAVNVLGQEAIDFEMDGCTVTGCARGAALDAAHNGVRRVRRTRFVDNFGADLQVGAGSHITACAFEGKPEGAEAQPFVQVKGTGGNVRIRDCSFGTAMGAPETLVCLGGPPAGPDVNEPVRDVQIVGCHMWIRDAWNTPPGSLPPCAVRLRAPTIGLQLRACSVWSGNLVLSEDFFGGLAGQLGSSLSFTGTWPPSSAQLVFDNVVSNLAIHPPALPALFSHGGRGFDVVGETATRAAGRGSDPFRGTTNLLLGSPGSDDGVLSWFSSGSAGLVDGSDGGDSPLGFHYSVSRNGSGAAWVEQAVSFEDWTSLIGEPMVFSCWMRSNGQIEDVPDMAGIRIEIQLNSLPIGGSAHRAIRLSTGWERYHVVAPRIPDLPAAAAAVMKVLIHLGESDEATGGTLSFCGAQLEPGDAPTPLTASGLDKLGAAVHSARAAQSLSLGPLVLGTTSEAPITTDGFNRGDALLNAKPKGKGDYDGWVCVLDGKELAWKRYGMLE